MWCVIKPTERKTSCETRGVVSCNLSLYFLDLNSGCVCVLSACSLEEQLLYCTWNRSRWLWAACLRPCLLCEETPPWSLASAEICRWNRLTCWRRPAGWSRQPRSSAPTVCLTGGETHTRTQTDGQTHTDRRADTHMPQQKDGKS